MKKFIKTLPTLIAPIHGEVLMMYLAASTKSISVAVLARREEGHVPFYFVSRVLQGAELNYPALEKLILALELTKPKNLGVKEVGRKTDAKLEEMKPSCEWKLYTNGASSSDSSGARLMLIDPE
ncbi:reverse transcriptase domain-containing protein, partial [Tanacetum coccineum]